MSPRDDDKGNFDDTEFPPDSENNDEDGQQALGRQGGWRRTEARSTDDEGDYDDKDQ